MKRYIDLIGVLLVTAVQLIVVFLDINGPVRVATGFLFVAFLPGYALLAGFYRPYRSQFRALEHVALAIPLSLALNTVLGLTLNLLKLGLHADLQAIWMASVVLLGIGWGLRNSVETSDTLRDVVFILVGVIVAAAFLNLSFFSVELKEDESFVSLFIVGKEGSLSTYPRAISVGKPVELVVGGDYRGETSQSFRLMSASMNESEEFVLQPGEHWERPFTIKLTEPGYHPLSWNLYEGEATTPARTVRIWVHVKTNEISATQ